MKYLIQDTKVNIFWFRRDLRLEDNHGLFQALQSGNKILPIFIFDTQILDQLTNRADRRVNFIFQTIQNINNILHKKGKSIKLYLGKPLDVFSSLVKEYAINAVFVNEDYEPYAINRDAAVKSMLLDHGITFHSFKDQVIFAKDDVLKADGKPYTVFTAYSQKWRSIFNPNMVKPFPSDQFWKQWLDTAPDNWSIETIGFKSSKDTWVEPFLDIDLIKSYSDTRNYPALNTSGLSLYLRFGLISIRLLTYQIQNVSEVFLNELIWREFFMYILYHFPHTVNHAFKPDYDRISWRDDEPSFETWCAGRTGYPMVDAGMRSLNQTGFMHNRVRMITASFLVKHLLIDWRWGEAYFANHLLDYDQSANVGNWQWAAGSGCDAAPYFRIFNPMTQQEKFDPDLTYIRQWIPEWGTDAYPQPMIDHSFARIRALETYKQALTNQ